MQNLIIKRRGLACNNPLLVTVTSRLQWLIISIRSLVILYRILHGVDDPMMGNEVDYFAKRVERRLRLRSVIEVKNAIETFVLIL